MNLLKTKTAAPGYEHRKMRSMKNAKREYNLTLLMLCLPGLICLFIFKYLPMTGVVIAFKDYVPLKGIFQSDWCGLKNFEFFFKSQVAGRTIRNTILYSIEFLVLDLIFGVTIAMLLYHLRSRIGLKVYHSVILLPRFLSIVIISFITYAFLSPANGLINSLIISLGGNPIQWYDEAKYWPLVLTIVYVWKSIGAGCLYYYAGLTGIDPSLLEAAELDGASTLQKVRYVLLPELVPIMVMMTILGIGGLFSGDMGLFYQVPRNSGLLFETTDIINTYTYRALLDGALANSAAVGLFQSVIGFILVVGTNQIVRKVSPENSMF